MCIATTRVISRCMKHGLINKILFCLCLVISLLKVPLVNRTTRPVYTLLF